LSRRIPMVAKKHLGQHFLRDTGVLDRLVRFIRPAARDVMIEIGAGDGALSTRLAPRVAHLCAVELDDDCISRLAAALQPFSNIRIVHADVMALELNRLADEILRPGLVLRIIGNLPYNLATAIIEKLLMESALPVEDMTFMLQQEMAQRIAAAPGSRDYGYFSVYCRYLCEVAVGFRVSPACFVPRPKVMSAVIRLRPGRMERDAAFEAALVELVKAAFSHRRKTLANSLRLHPSLGGAAGELLFQAGIDGSRRPEQLSVSEYEHLAHTYICRKALNPS